MISESPIYFRIPTSLKEDFDTICRNSKTNKTHTLYTFIRNLVNDTKLNEPELLESVDQLRQSEWTTSKKKEKSIDPFAGMWGR